MARNNIKTVGFFVFSLMGCQQGTLPLEKQPKIVVYSVETTSADAEPLEKGTEAIEVAPIPEAVAAPVIVDDLSPEEIGKLATALIKDRCEVCHNQVVADGGFSIVSDVSASLESGKYLVAGEPENSLTYTRLAPLGNMPPNGNFTANEAKIIAAWITSGLATARTVVVPLTNDDMVKNIRSDLEKNIAAIDRPNIRYFSLQTMNNAGATKEELNVYRQALAKTLNSVSSAPVVYKLKAIDTQELIYRVNLTSDLGIAVPAFNRMVADTYVFTQDFQDSRRDRQKILAADHAFAKTETKTNIYVVRSDWFIATALLPANYALLLNLPKTILELETSLGINFQDNIKNKKIMRSGFKDSGVSINNRMIERHATNTGRYYWISYDFAGEASTQNILTRPLSINDLKESTAQDAFRFTHDGGEVLFQLPNGFMGYYLLVAAGTAVEKGPLTIVKNKKGPEEFLQAIVNGISCLSCHAKGFLEKKDEVAGIVAASADFSNEVKAFVKEVYPPEAQFKATMEKDTKTYIDAQIAAGIDVVRDEPVTPAFINYNAKMTKSKVLAELSITSGKLDELLASEPFQSSWVGLLVEGGTLKREEFNKLFGVAINTAGTSVTFTNPILGDYLLSARCMVKEVLFLTPDCINTEPALVGVPVAP
jgi:serine/threonine-protein kinase